ncbi:MAG TPA: prephenate dehydrogenase/arogenate dehydrogenase family protein [Candidatus Paceibacterota bacterium]
MKKISIVGFGRFGRVLYELLKNDFEIVLYSKSKIERDDGFAKSTTIAENVAKVYESDVVFYAAPIAAFEEVISTHQKYFGKKHLLIDVLSVKIHPASILNKYLEGTGAKALLTHPMFGPDSITSGFQDLPMIMDKFTANTEDYDFWKKYFSEKGLRIVEITPEEHDKLAADSQGLTHFIGRLLESYGLAPTKIDSVGTKKLLEVMDQTCHDTWQLFENLQHYNPYTKKMRVKLGEKYDELYNKLLPAQLDTAFVTYGIQGGVGSFNEEAIQYYIKREKIGEHKILYLHTAENVMRALHEGEIDRGQVAIHNSVGGIVEESIHAMANYKFKILEQFQIKISHALMIHPDAKLSEISTIMSHPQVFAQCKDTLAKKYPQLKQTSGEGERIDHAVVAKELGEGKLPKTTATMGSSVLAKLYGLKIVEDNLQDARENYTSFLQIARIQ